MKEFSKKEERYYLEEFRKTLSDFPAGTIVDSEEPDFLISQEDAITLGIEVTKLYQTQPLSRVPKQATEALMDQIVQRACSVYQTRGGPILSVWVQFQFGLQLRKARVAQLASKIAEIVSATPIGVNQKIALRNDYSSLALLPEEIDSIRISRSSFRSRALWTPANGAFIPHHSVDEIQARIDEKNKRAASYRKKSEEIWLLIVHSLPFSLASTFEASEDAFMNRYRADFERVFLFDVFSKTPVELPLATADSI